MKLRLSHWIQSRAVRITILLLVIAPLAYAASWHRDWFYFYLEQHRVARDMAQFTQTLHSIGLPMHSLGEVRCADASYPLWMLETRPANVPSSVPVKTMCLWGGVHGNEPAGTEALLAFARDAAQLTTQPATRYVIVPLANPWGWAHGLRHNGGNQDIARQFANGGTQETVILQSLVAQQHCDMLVDLHEDRFHHGFYALSYAAPDAARLLKAVEQIEQRTGVTRATQAPQGLWQVPESEFASVQLTTGALWARQHGVPWALIVESYDGLPMAQRLRIHREAITQFSRFLEGH